MAFGQRTWRFEGGGSAASDCAPASQSNRPLAISPGSTSRVQATVSPAAGVQDVFSWTTDAGDPDLADWPSGTFTCQWQIGAVPSGCFGRCELRQVATGCAQKFAQADASFFLTAGLYVFSVPLNLPPGARSDRLQAVLQVFFPSGSSGTLSVLVGHPDSWLSAPLQPGNPVTPLIPRLQQPLHLLRR